jgi:hypothetical protein
MKKGMTLIICGKTSDMCSATLTDADGKVLKEHDGYVPSFMPGEHWGDYIILEIDVDSGKILNWKKPTKAQIDAFIKTGK